MNNIFIGEYYDTDYPITDDRRVQFTTNKRIYKELRGMINDIPDGHHLYISLACPSHQDISYFNELTYTTEIYTPFEQTKCDVLRDFNYIYTKYSWTTENYVLNIKSPFAMMKTLLEKNNIKHTFILPMVKIPTSVPSLGKNKAVDGLREGRETIRYKKYTRFLSHRHTVTPSYRLIPFDELVADERTASFWIKYITDHCTKRENI